MRGNSHVRFGAGDEETCLGNGVRRFIPTLPKTAAALFLYSGRARQLGIAMQHTTRHPLHKERLRLRISLWEASCRVRQATG